MIDPEITQLYLQDNNQKKITHQVLSKCKTCGNILLDEKVVIGDKNSFGFPSKFGIYQPLYENYNRILARCPICNLDKPKSEMFKSLAGLNRHVLKYHKDANCMFPSYNDTLRFLDQLSILHHLRVFIK